VPDDRYLTITKKVAGKRFLISFDRQTASEAHALFSIDGAEVQQDHFEIALRLLQGGRAR
jgi:hypothetical protein